MGKANTEVPVGQERKILIFSAYASKYNQTASNALGFARMPRSHICVTAWIHGRALPHQYHRSNLHGRHR